MEQTQQTELIDSTKASVQQAKSALLQALAFVPEDKLHWSPSPTARTPLWIAAHCGAANQVFAAILRGEEPPLPEDRAEALKQIRAGGQDAQTRSEAEQSIEDSTEKILQALDAVTPDRLETTPKNPLGPMPFTVWMATPAAHMTGHTSQIEYLQTIWGDIEAH